MTHVGEYEEVGAGNQLGRPLGTAELIPGANLLVLGDMGHDLPEPLWPLVVGAITNHIATSAGVAATV